MPSPLERLTKIIDSYIPSELVFRVLQAPCAGDTLILNAITVKPQSWKTNDEDAELQLILTEKIREWWNQESCTRNINTRVEDLWHIIKYDIVREYEHTSMRCVATRRKTISFINSIKIEDKHLPNYLINVYMNIHSTTYEKSRSSEQEALFEQFESLRKTYGKRK
jgi:hypothetical protein